MLDGLAHEIWAVAQLAPNEGIVDGVDRIKKVLEEAAEISIQHTQPEKCLGCYHWAFATLARCVRGGGSQCVIKGGTHQASA